MITPRCEIRLQGVHPDMVRVVKRAAEACEFIVVEGVRTLEKQREYFQAGKSKTMNSRHLPKPAKGCDKPVSHAVDLCPRVDTDGDGDLDLSWEPKHFRPLADAMKLAAWKEGVAIVWGGDWTTFLDMPHFELDRRFYP